VNSRTSSTGPDGQECLPRADAARHHDVGALLRLQSADRVDEVVVEELDRAVDGDVPG
jgi:hypothetical protein